MIRRLVHRQLAKAVAWIDSHTVTMPDGCPNCHFLLINRPEYDTCPHCGWGPDTEPDKTAEEARQQFLENVMEAAN